jgi:hypothetical protein
VNIMLRILVEGSHCDVCRRDDMVSMLSTVHSHMEISYTLSCLVDNRSRTLIFTTKFPYSIKS